MLGLDARTTAWHIDDSSNVAGLNHSVPSIVNIWSKQDAGRVCLIRQTTSDINFSGGRVRASGKRRGVFWTVWQAVTRYICVRDDWQHSCRTSVQKSWPFRLWPHAGSWVIEPLSPSHDLEVVTWPFYKRKGRKTHVECIWEGHDFWNHVVWQKPLAQFPSRI